MASVCRAAGFRDNNADGAWTDPATWTIESGSDADGVPDSDDEVRLRTKSANSTYAIAVSNAWSCDKLIFEASSGAVNERHRLSVTGNGSVRVVEFYDNHPALFRGPEITFNNLSCTFTCQKLHSLGPEPPSWLVQTTSTTLALTGDVEIAYCANGATPLAGGNDFSNAASVHLARSTNSGAFTDEALANVPGNRKPFILGRGDGVAQVWHAAAGSRPVLRAIDGTQGAGFMKVGTGDVLMADIDLAIVCAGDHSIGVSANGRQAGTGSGLFQGALSANSLSYVRLDSTNLTARHFDVSGRVLLSGQAGRQAGGTGNGRAFSVTGNTNALTLVRIQTS
jgi:hypothetical protein